MKTWELLKEEIKNQSELDRIEIEALEKEMAFLNKLINTRKQKNITQKKLAEKLNVPQSAISRFESKANSPRLDTVLEIAEALGVTIDINNELDYKVDMSFLNFEQPNYNYNDWCDNEIKWSKCSLKPIMN